MKRNLPLVLIACLLVLSSFNGEKKSKKVWYKATDGSGYISLERIDIDNTESVLNTTVNAYFGNEKLQFTTSTTCESNKLANASKIQFNGTIDSNMNPVVYNGERVKLKRNASYWSFQGDFKNEITNDPEVNKFLYPNHSAVIRMPLETIPSFNVWAIVPNLPFDKAEGTFKFNSLDETKLYVKKAQTVNYLGEFNTDVAGENQSLHKFVHQGKKMKPAYYWVNNDRELVKIQLDGDFEFVKSTKEEALGKVIANISED